jgi:hypothetical protein
MKTHLLIALLGILFVVAGCDMGESKSSDLTDYREEVKSRYEDMTPQELEKEAKRLNVQLQVLNARIQGCITHLQATTNEARTAMETLYPGRQRKTPQQPPMTVAHPNRR